MATPKTRAEFKEYCLRALGKGVININVSNDQVEDRIDEALQFWQDHHYNGSQHTYLAIEMTQDMIDNNEIQLPSYVLSVIGVNKPAGEFSDARDWMSIRYQLRFDDVFALTREGITSYYITRQSLATFEHVMTQAPRVDFNMISGRLKIRANTTEKWGVGQFIFVECWVATQPDDAAWDQSGTPPDPVPDFGRPVWSDRILQKLATAYIKRQWGENLKKFVGVQLAGGVQLNADSILQGALQDIENLERDFILRYQMPDEFYIG